MLPHPDFATNHLLYLSYARPKGEGSTTAVVRGRFENDRFTAIADVFESQSQGRGHYGGRLAWDRDGYLFVSVGDRMARTSGDLSAHPAQDLSNHHGVTVRLHDDGRVPGDNPFVGQHGVLPAIWSYGHRNPQWLLVHPETGDLWANEHGPQGGDELNLIRPGRNYGWPVVGYGVNRTATSTWRSSSVAGRVELCGSNRSSAGRLRLVGDGVGEKQVLRCQPCGRINHRACLHYGLPLRDSR